MCQDVRGAGVLNFAERGVNRIVTRAFEKSFMESGCKFCLSCVEVCPTGALMDKGKWEGPPCQPACPAGIDIPRYVRFIAEGRFAEALAVIREKVPFPAVLGRICDHPCEDECQRGKLNEPIAIRALKRFVSEHDAELWKANIHLHTSTGKRVAIIGSGPAGLTTAYYLAKLGHSITVFEASAEPGGMMQVGIPEYRLPKAIVKREIEQIKNVGVDIKTNTKVESIAQLSQQGYDAIFIAIGAHRDGDMGVEGENSPGVIGGLSFLKSLNLLGRGEIGKDVAVIGGTHTALDTARTARRLGAEEVSIFCPQTKINAGSEQIERAIEEGVKISYLVNVKKIVSVQPPSVTLSEAKGLGDSSPSAQNDSMGEQKINRQNGKLKVEFTSVEGGFTTDFDNVINAVNQEPEGLEGWGLSLNKSNTIEVDPNTLASNKEGVFAGGDVVTGPATVIQAIAMGRKVASSIDRYLGGEGNIDEELVKPEKPSLYIGRDEHFAERNRVEPPCLSVEERIKNFNEVELGLNQDKAIEEAKRCLRCDLRLLISSPPLPPKPWLKFDAETIATIPEVEGVYQLLDEDKNIIYIKGAMNLREELSEQLETNEEAAYLLYKEAPMYTSRESELIQQFLQKYGRLPEQNAGGLEDLF
jgi:NADPH-dependent glutamate synthase beta subunit-like oxidoreductase